MRPDEWAQVKALFEAALEMPGADRERFLADAASDPAVLHEVRLLLLADSEATGSWTERWSDSIADHVSLRMLEPGASIGPYRIDAQIGRSGMGVVYRAYDTRLERAVALKLVNDVSLDATMRSSLLREAQCASALNHPHVCTVFDFGEFQGDPYIVMEWIDGRPLSDITRTAGLTPEEALRYGAQVADALAHAHAGGVVHGDLKSANILITKDHRAKLLDFGVARRISRQGETSPLGASPRGTPVYMAPEMLRGEAASERSDVWSFGCVLQELMTGALPFAGPSMTALASAILNDAPAALPSSVPEPIRPVVARCLAKDPRQRYRDGTELWRAVTAAIEGNRGATTAFAGLSPMSADMPSIAVLPFVNTSKINEHDYFADGLSDEMLNVLTRIRGLRVASRTSAFSFKGKDVDLATIANTLNVATILEGSVRTSGKRVRITADLIHVATDSCLWSQTYDRELDDIFAVQDDIAQSVVKELRAALLPDTSDVSSRGSVKAEVEAAVKGRGANPEAYRLYLQGKFFADRMTDVGFEKGIAHYRQALAVDPEYALAWAGLSLAHASMSRQGFVRSAAAFDEARQAAEHALRYEPGLPEAHLAMGLVRMEFEWDWAGATSSIQRALTLAPGNADVVSVAAELALTLGRLDEAVTLSQRAVMLDPLSVTTHKNLGRHCYYAGDLDQAEPTIAKMLEISPNCGLGHYLLGYVYLMQGKQDAALGEFHQEPLEKFRLLGLALVHHAKGDATRSDTALRELVERESVSASQIAWAYAYRGEPDHAFDWLDRACDRRDTPAWLARHPLLAGLHNDPRWPRFLERMGLTSHLGS